MTSQVEYVAFGIVRVLCTDPLRLDEAAWAVDECTRLANAWGDKHCIIIVDLSGCSHIPFDLQTLIPFAAIDPRVDAYVVIGADRALRRAMRLLQQTTAPRYLAVKSFEAAVDAAWQVLSSKRDSAVDRNA